MKATAGLFSFNSFHAEFLKFSVKPVELSAGIIAVVNLILQILDNI